MKKILIFGANSAVAQAVARLYAMEGANLYLVGRNKTKLSALEADLKARGQGLVFAESADLCRCDLHHDMIHRAKAALQGLDSILIAHGELGDQPTAQESYGETFRLLEVNLLSVLSILTTAANEFAAAGQGTIAVITSVAGDRGRGTNYVYGTAKGALSIFLSGLRNRLATSKVAVLDIKLGLVDTPMTSTFKKGPLWASPRGVAKPIKRAIDSRKDVVYVPGFWRLIMLIIRLIPERIFKTLKI